LLLCGDPAAFHARKPEIGSDEVLRQLREWQHIAPRTGRRMVDLDTVHETVEQCAATVVAALSNSRRWRRVPIAPRRLQLRATGAGPALDIYRPHRRLARLASPLNGPLLRLGLARVASPPPLPDLTPLFDRRCPGPEQLVALRSSAPERWIIAVAQGRRLHTVIKVGRADAGLERELVALRRLSSTETVSLPRLVGELHGDGWLAMATGAVRTTDRPASLTEVVELVTALSRGDLGLPVVHGDLAPWNLSSDQHGVIVWDWEESELGTARPLHDLTHYLVRAGTLLGDYSPEETVRLLTLPGGPGAQHLEALELPLGAAPDYILSYLARTKPATRSEQDFRAAVRRRVASLSR
jgi:hypothetical protein